MVNEIDSETLQARLAAGEDLLLVDVRTAAEVAQGAIPGAMHIEMHLLPLRAAELPKDKDVVLYCRSGARSHHCCQFLEQQGIGNSLNLRGGIIAWARHGYQIGRLDAA
ncbi:rhodanese-like domain-containing protein [Thiohalocapsa marina]|uniref:Rhodanese-like domain-containing protein n=1 Tax=Thiohalocapsa marina TaxID=424902 RepID=A0A5M8FHG2_9GAMM|nr:rhodanese-like domain-containing protein [Thiohalocapsa marina]KAA6184167.1 rhodanese-like domain-containing protein [Thiohalocapsa marina]